MSKIRKKNHFSQAQKKVCFYMTNPEAIWRLCPPWQIYKNFQILCQNKISFVLKEIFFGFPLKQKMLIHRQVEKKEDDIIIKTHVVNSLYPTFFHKRFIHKDTQLGETCFLDDELTYTPPFGFLGSFLNRHEIAPKLNRILKFQYDRMRHDLPLVDEKNEKHSVLLTGSDGFIGSHLKNFLNLLGHFVSHLEREKFATHTLTWNPDTGEIDENAVEGIHTVIHLAGESLFNKRWTPEQKKYLLENRKSAALTIAKTAAQATKKPKTIIFASAIGAYGKNTPHDCTEETQTSNLETDFPAQVCREIEEAASIAKDAGIRVIILRLGIVLNPRGGALAQLLLPFKLGLGGPLSSGKHHMSWIGLEDLMRLIHYIMMHNDIEGIVNATTPHYVTNRYFSKTLAKTMKRPCLFMVPKFMIKLLFGEMGEDLLLSNSKVLPQKIESHGFTFLTPHLKDALNLEIYGQYPENEDT